MSKEFVDGKGEKLYLGYETDEIVANPELDGTEVPLTSLKLGDDKYKIESDSAYYEVKASDITITGTSSPYPITMSSELETAILSGKRALFVSGTIMNAITGGEVTTDTLFNIISYDKLTQTDYKHIIAFSTYTSLFGIVTISAIFLQDDNNQWYIIDGKSDVDIDYLQQQIADLDNRVQALETNEKTYYNHNIVLKQSGGNQVLFNITIISSRDTEYDLRSLAQYLYDKGYSSENYCISVIPCGYSFNFRVYSTNRTSISLKLQEQSNNLLLAQTQYCTFIGDTVTEI